MRANDLGITMNTLKQSKRCKRLPRVCLPAQMGNPKRGSSLGIEAKVEGEEGDIGKGAINVWLRVCKDEIFCLYDGETRRSGIGNVGCTDRAVIICECENVAPETIVREQRRKELSIVRCACELELREPVLSDRVHLMLDGIIRSETLPVGRQVGGKGSGEVGGHFAGVEELLDGFEG